MQKTRELIVNILKMRGEATVEELSEELGLTSVTVRHHMEILREEGVVGPPQPLRRDQPGRPQYIYRLADGAEELFPNNYDILAAALLHEMGEVLPEEQVEEVVKRIGEKMANHVELSGEKGSAAALDDVIAFLNEKGFMVTLAESEDGHTLIEFHNCPYKRIARDCCDVCKMDDYMLTELFGGEPIRTTNIIEGASSCTYVLPHVWDETVEETA